MAYILQDASRLMRRDLMWHRGRARPRPVNPTAFTWATFSHPSLWVWNVRNQERLINSSAVSPALLARSGARRQSTRPGCNVGRVYGKRSFDMTRGDSLAWDAALSHRETRDWKQCFQMTKAKSQCTVIVTDPFIRVAPNKHIWEEDSK